MIMRLTKGKIITFIIISLLVIDQIVKIWIKTHMTIGESIPVFVNWFQIYFIENNGMAFGMQFGGVLGKLILTLLRMVLIGAILYYLVSLLKKSAPIGVLVGISLICVGATGNLIDSIFYGIIFDESTLSTVSTLLPEGGGYAGLLQGKVVDMLYFPLIDTDMPEWVPIFGGERFIFFRPIFNIADSCITIGVIYLILFQRKYFSQSEEKSKV